MTEDQLHDVVKRYWPALQAAISHSVVRLAYFQRLVDPAGSGQKLGDYCPAQTFASGFIVSIDGAWAFFTAGHVLRTYLNVEEELSGQKLGKSFLEYGYHLLSETNDKLPHAEFPFDKKSVGPFENDGYDYGFIPIHEPLRTTLYDAGVRPFTIEQTSEENQAFHLYAVLGIPTDLMDAETNETPGVVRDFARSDDVLQHRTQQRFKHPDQARADIGHYQTAAHITLHFPSKATPAFL